MSRSLRRPGPFARTVLLVLVALAGGLLAPGAGPALAAEAGDQGTDQSELVWQAVNLAILLGIIVYFARRPVRDYFAERREGIRHEVEEAATLLKQAETRYAEWQRKLVELDGELEQIRAQARRRAHEERDRILEEARAAAERMRRDADAAIDQEVRRAGQELRREAADLAVELAARMLREKVDERDQSRLVDEFITGVEREAGAGARGRS